MDATIKQLKAAAARISHLKAPRGKALATVEAIIVTDAQGRPFACPEAPAQTATIEDKIAYLRAVAARNDAIADYANVAFSSAFKKVLRGAK